MSVSKRTNQEILKKRKRKLEAALLSLPVDQPRAGGNRTMLEKEIELVKAELRAVKQDTGKAAPAPVKRNKSKPTNVIPIRSGKGKKNASKQAAPARRSKKPPLPGGASFPSFQLPSPKSPTFVEDSLKTVGNLRALCRQGLGYLQRADQLFDSLHGVGSHLQEQGILPKILQGKMKELNTNDWTTILLALMNSPLSGMLLGSPGGGNGSGAQVEPQAQTASATKEQDGQA